MHNSSFSKKLLLLTLLTSVATLTACGKKESQPTPASSSSVAAKVTSKSSSAATTVVSSASSTSAEAQTEVQAEEEVTETSSEEAATEETAGETEEESSPAQAEPSNLPTTFDLHSLAAGDYSSIAGTWANAKGQVFTITAEGILYFGEEVDDGGHHKIERAGINSAGRVGGSLGFYQDGERAGGAHISMVPAGVPNMLGTVTDIDHIEIGQSENAAYPEEQFFRQD